LSVWHSVRRHRALRVLHGAKMPRSILVVCFGNICRSPFAAAVLERKLASFGTTIASGGIGGYRAAAPTNARVAARRLGYSLDTHISQGIPPDLARTADLVIVMDALQQRMLHERYGVVRRRILVLGDLDPRPNEDRTIIDPVDQRLTVFNECYARIERCVGALVDALLVGRDDLTGDRVPRRATRSNDEPASRTPSDANRQASTMAGTQSSTHSSS